MSRNRSRDGPSKTCFGSGPRLLFSTGTSSNPNDVRGKCRIMNCERNSPHKCTPQLLYDEDRTESSELKVP
ncbi:hypothetical protein EVAR_39386_1 [Eumeta japonica]|uniref:Uncharacterized protein n=1 Tax=Eumeta variegata TaxID=151549 RepID=A0A4C1ZAY8_EUMVA|nr:hypothetical protein EVAR_39386_1 [Eumeta japonica]